MAKFTERQLKSNDIDWYCLINGNPVHIASMGGLIPSDFRERKELRQIAEFVIQLPYSSEVDLNIDFIREQTQTGYSYLDKNGVSEIAEEIFGTFPSYNYHQNLLMKEKMFAYSFIEKGRRGFYSYAREGDTNKYVLVATPKTPLVWNEERFQLKSLQVQVAEGRIPEDIEL